MGQTKPRPDETSAALLGTRQRALFRSLPGALVGQEEPIHQLRVAGRRLRMALATVAARPDSKRVRRARETIRELGLAAGRARDLDVMLDLLDRRLMEAPRFNREQILLRRRLRAAQRRIRRRMIDTLLDRDVARLRRDLRTLHLAGLAEREAVRARLLEHARAEELAATATCVSIRRLDVEAVHRLRRHVRRLRYVAEIAQEAFELDEQVSALLKQVQERLGAVRDTWLLAGWLRQAGESAERRGQPDVARAARGLQRAFHLRTRELFTVWHVRPGTTVIARCARKLRVCLRLSEPPR